MATLATGQARARRTAGATRVASEAVCFALVRTPAEAWWPSAGPLIEGDYESKNHNESIFASEPGVVHLQGLMPHLTQGMTQGAIVILTQPQTAGIAISGDKVRTESEGATAQLTRAGCS